MNNKAFTLIELLVVVAIIGILAAIGVNTFSVFQEKAKVSATKANHKSVIKWVTAELVKCDLDSSVSIFNGQITCSTIASKLSGNQKDAANKVAKELEKGLKDKFKNPYGEYRNPSTNDYKSDNAVTRAGWGKDRDLGYTIIESTTHPTTGKARLNIHTCNKLSCVGDWWNNTNDNIEICLIEVRQ
jgi:prepilin-type N-terminal cleavage/methylation domain-containing protein